MASTQRFVGAKTAFGVIVEVELRVYNPVCLVRSRTGEISPKPLATLIALGLERPKIGANA